MKIKTRSKTEKVATSTAVAEARGLSRAPHDALRERKEPEASPATRFSEPAMATRPPSSVQVWF